MKKYFVTCREALESKLLLQVCMRLGSALVVGSCYCWGYSAIGIFSNRTGTSVDDGKARGKD